MARLKFETFPVDLISLYELTNKLGDDRPLRRLLLLARELGCQSIVYQRQLTNPGFQSEWEEYYKHTQPRTKRTVEKLDFFTIQIYNQMIYHNCDHCNTTFECSDEQHHISCNDYFQWKDRKFNCPKCVPDIIIFPQKSGEQPSIYRYDELLDRPVIICRRIHTGIC